LVFTFFKFALSLQGLVLVKPSTWRKHRVSFFRFHTLHSNVFKNVLILHIGLICKVKAITIFQFYQVPLVDLFLFSFLFAVNSLTKHWCHSWLIFYKLKIWEFDSIKFHVRLFTSNVNIHVHIIWCECFSNYETFKNAFHYLKKIIPYLLLGVFIHQWLKCFGWNIYYEIYSMVHWQVQQFGVE
jgi:hypothetical protein